MKCPFLDSYDGVVLFDRVSVTSFGDNHMCDCVVGSFKNWYQNPANGSRYPTIEILMVGMIVGHSFAWIGMYQHLLGWLEVLRIWGVALVWRSVRQMNPNNRGCLSLGL